MRNSRSRCLRLRVYRLGENATSHSVPVLGPGTALVWLSQMIYERIGRLIISKLATAKGP